MTACRLRHKADLGDSLRLFNDRTKSVAAKIFEQNLGRIAALVGEVVKRYKAIADDGNFRSIDASC